LTQDKIRVILNTGKQDDMAKIKPLRENDLFKDFSDKEIAVVSQIVSEKAYPKGTPIYVENMLGESLFIVKSGSVEIKKNLGAGGENLVAVIGPGELFGEMAILEGGPRLVSAKAQEETELLMISGDDFKAFMEKEPVVCLKLFLGIIKMFTRRIRELMPLVEEFLSWKSKKK